MTQMSHEIQAGPDMRFTLDPTRANVAKRRYRCSAIVRCSQTVLMSEFASQRVMSAELIGDPAGGG